MEPEQSLNLNPTLRRSVWALSAFSLVALILTRELDLHTMLAAGILTPIFYLLDGKGRLKRIRWLENSLILADFAAGASRFFYFKHSFLIIIADFLVFFILLKFAFKKELGDFLQMIYLSFFILLSCSTLSLDVTFILSFILYIMLVSWTLSIYNLCQPAEDALPSRSPLRSKEILGRIRKNAWMTLWLALAFAAAIFMFFPRLSFTVFQGAFLGPVHAAGFTEKVSLQKSGKIFKDPKVMMRVQIRQSGSKAWKGFLYLRGQALSRFDGQNWSAGPRLQTKITYDTFRTKMLKISRVAKNRFPILSPDDWHYLKTRAGMKLEERSFITQTIFLESMDTSLLFGAPWIESVTAKLPRVTVFQDGTVSRPPDFKGRISYEVVSVVERPPAGAQPDPGGRLQLPYVTEKDDGEVARNLEVPSGVEKIAQFGQKMFSKRDRPYTKAIKTEKYLRENYKYTLDLTGAEASSPLEDFLFVSKEGHCEYFASAMALILRTQGIPARMASGFLMDEQNVSGEYYVVRAQDAHAWVEAFIGGIWTQFDPTPRARRFEAEEITPWQRVKQVIDHVNFLWIFHVLGYDQEYQERVALKMQAKSTEISRKMDRTLEKIRGHARIPWKKLILAPLVFVVFFIFRSLRRHWKVGERADASFQFYTKMLETLARRGFFKKAGETPNEFAMRIERDLKNGSGEIQNLTRIFCALRYGSQILELNEDFLLKNSLKSLKVLLG